MASQHIQIVVQSAETGARLEAPGNWTPSSKLAEVVQSLQPRIGSSLETTAIRYVQTTVPFEKWSSTTLKSIGLGQGGRALLTIQKVKNKEQPPTSPMSTSNKPLEGALNEALKTLLKSNFDVDTKECLKTLIKVLDNILQQPGNDKVRTIRLANSAFNRKVVSRKGGVDILVGCGFQVQEAPPQLLSNIPSGEQCVVLKPENESTSNLVTARRLITTCAIQELGMDADELPKFKQPVRLTDPGDHAVGRKAPAVSSGEFNPYQGHRYDAKSAALGKNLGPDGKYESTTEKQLQMLQNQQAKLEKSMHRPLADRELSASLPNTTEPAPMQIDSVGSGPSDGSLLASRMKRMQDERKQREEGGFTTKAMRDLQQLKKQKVYSHVQLRIQFPDSSVLEAKFLPKETVQTVKDVVQSCFVLNGFDFDLYIAPPRRLLELSKTLDSEGLVPAAKIFVSWKVDKAPTKEAPVGSFMKPELFHGQATQAYPSAQSLAGGKKPAPAAQASKKAKEPTREDDLLKRMMGGHGGLGRSSKKRDKGGTGKPKWFKG